MMLDDKVRFTLRLNDNLTKLIEEECDVKGVSKNAFIIEVLWNFFENQKRKQTIRK